MAAPSHLTDHPVSRRHVSRLRRRCAAVGVEVSGSRLRQIAAGAPATEQERVDIGFAETAFGIRREQRSARRRRARRRCLHSTIVLGATVLALVLLLGLGVAFFALASHTSPF